MDYFLVYETCSSCGLQKEPSGILRVKPNRDGQYGILGRFKYGKCRYDCKNNTWTWGKKKITKAEYETYRAFGFRRFFPAYFYQQIFWKKVEECPAWHISLAFTALCFDILVGKAVALTTHVWFVKVLATVLWGISVYCFAMLLFVLVIAFVSDN